MAILIVRITQAKALVLDLAAPAASTQQQGRIATYQGSNDDISVQTSMIRKSLWASGDASRRTLVIDKTAPHIDASTALTA
jgi:hypothetical protein